MLSEEAFKRLPKAARHEIERLMGDVAFWKEKAMGASNGKDARVVVECGLEERGLPDSACVVFRLGPNAAGVRRRSIEVQLVKQPGGEEGVAVRCDGGRLAVYAGASNLVYVGVC